MENILNDINGAWGNFQLTLWLMDDETSLLKSDLSKTSRSVIKKMQQLPGALINGPPIKYDTDH
jgi:hypothetical protein